MTELNGSFGETRSILRREYLLHTPDAFVRTPLPGITGGSAIVHCSPRLGAGFLQYTVELEQKGTLRLAASPNTQRFLWVCDGEPVFELDAGTHTLCPNSYAFLGLSSAAALTARAASRLMLIEKLYEPIAGHSPPPSFVAREQDVPALPLGGDPRLLVRSLLPSDIAFDFAVNTMAYAPGASLSQVEVHVMEHGLLMLEGAGTYRLGDDRHLVQAGDFIWMAPFCPQWFIAQADAPAKYLIYKDWNRRPTL